MEKLTKAKLRQKVIDLLENDSRLFGDYADAAILEFIEREKICPAAVIAVMGDLTAEGYGLRDGRVFIENPRPLPWTHSEQFTQELWAHKHLHTGGIQCPTR